MLVHLSQQMHGYKNSFGAEDEVLGALKHLNFLRRVNIVTSINDTMSYSVGRWASPNVYYEEADENSKLN